MPVPPVNAEADADRTQISIAEAASSSIIFFIMIYTCLFISLPRENTLALQQDKGMINLHFPNFIITDRYAFCNTAAAHGGFSVMRRSDLFDKKPGL